MFDDYEAGRPAEAPSSSSNDRRQRRTLRGYVGPAFLALTSLAVVCAFAVLLSNAAASRKTTTTTTMSLKKDDVYGAMGWELPSSLEDEYGMHTFIKTNYLLYSGFAGDMSTSKALPKAKDDPTRTPQTAKGAREAAKEVVATNNYLYIEAFTDPNCASSSFQGFMAFKINTCIPAWMFSSTNQKLWLRNKGEVKETKIITQTDLFSDPTCTTSVSIKPVNQSNNQACGAWNSQGSMFAKFALKDTIPLDAYGSGVLIQSHGEEDCSDDAAEILYMVSRDAECQGRFEGVCGDDEVSFTRFEDYGCQGGKSSGYPMKIKKTCGFANSVGFAKYGYATCNTAEAPAVIMTVEGQTRFVGSEFKEDDDDLSTSTKKKIAKLKKKYEKAEAKEDAEAMAKYVEEIEALGGKVTKDDDGVAVTEISEDAQEAMDKATAAVQQEVADALDVEPSQVEMLGSHYDYKGNNGFAIKYQVTGLDEDSLDKTAKKMSSSKTAKNIKKALKKAGVEGFSVEKADTTLTELVPTDFYEEEIVAASKAVGKVTNIAEEDHELVSFDETKVFDSRDESKPSHDAKAEEATEEEWATEEETTSSKKASATTGTVETVADTRVYPVVEEPVVEEPVATAVVDEAATEATTAALVANGIPSWMGPGSSSSSAKGTTTTTTTTSGASTTHASGPTAQKAASTASTSTTAAVPAVRGAAAPADTAPSGLTMKQLVAGA